MADLEPLNLPYQSEVVEADRRLSKPWLNAFMGWMQKVKDGAVNLVSGTAGRILVTGTQSNPIINIDPAYVASAAQGGTGQSSYTLGDTLYASAPMALSKLPGVIPNRRYFLGQAGTGTISAAPVWLPELVFNVTDPLYGAIGNGVTDDRAAIARADAAAAMVSGLVVFPPGIYLIGSSLTVASDVELIPGAILSVSAGATLNLLGAFEASGSQFVDFLTGSGSYAFGQSVKFIGGSLQTVQGTMNRMSISSNLLIPAGWCSQMVAPVVESGSTVTVEAGGLWFVNA